MPEPRLYIEGVREVRKILHLAGGPPLTKEMGKVHKDVGRLVITAAGGAKTGVGTGAGATIRPSAATREVILRVGGAHRNAWGRVGRWGRRWNGPENRRRPYLVGAAVSIQDKLSDRYLDGIETVLRKAGAK